MKSGQLAIRLGFGLFIAVAITEWCLGAPWWMCATTILVAVIGANEST